MKKIEIIYDEALEKQILMILRQREIKYYTRLDNVKGVGSSGARFNDSVAPGINSMIIIVVEDDIGSLLIDSLKKFKSRAGSEAGFKAIVIPINEFT